MNSTSQPQFVCRWEPTELATAILSAPSREVVSYWISALAFLDDHRHPVMLAMSSQSEPTFSQLVAAVNLNFSASVVLNELLRKGVVEQLDSGHVLLRRSTYVHDVPGLEVSPGRRRYRRNSAMNLGNRHNDET
ncbi:DUF6502 family protein [Marinobacter sp. 2_MG-2023]|uniref:DUF6502 family protein n=1 Tax=Marinobacter sp. 2_MG-2023 TaxID=3062679 RepID=UPI0026E35BEC|nr:DUF6502 family protein [Marinobacter sp. 2_MG-2023]MDO6442778.1 DUF6502 family protein [Marinobacter sp. 2_MG-2023]